MSDWNFQELRELSRAKNRIYPDEFVDSLFWRKQRAEIHAEEANRVWKELFAASFALGDERYTKAYFIYAAHAECCAHCLISLVDLSAQIINVTILNGEFAEEKVSIWEINKFLKNKCNYIDISNSIGVLIKDDSFNYLRAFSNINKHRKLIHGDFRAEFGRDRRNEQGVIFRDFSYNGKGYPKTWGSDIIGTHKDKMISLICSLGESINAYIKDN